MKIVLLNEQIPPEGRGGAERVAWELARGLHQAGHEVHVIVITAHPAFTELRDGIMTYHLHAGYPLRWQGWLSLYNPQTIPALRQLLKRIQPDVVHAHNIHRNLSYASLIVAHRMGFPVVFTAHDLMTVVYSKLTHWVDPRDCAVPDPGRYRIPPLYNLREMKLRYNPFRNLIIRAILKSNVDIRTCVSRAQQQALIANGLPSFTVIPNGLDPDRMAATAEQIEALRTRLDLADHPIILFAGRMSAAKGSGQLLHALEKVIIRQPNALLLILSDKPITWESEAQHTRLADHVRSAGWLTGSDLNAAYHLADVVAVPSIYLDPLPTVVLEAMTARKPVIATCYGGPSEIVIDGATGYIVNPFDTEPFADRLNDLLAHPTLAQQMGEAGRRRLESTFSLSTQTTRFTAIYQQLMR